MNRGIATWIVAALFSVIIAILIYVGIRPTRTIVIQILPPAIPHFEAMITAADPGFDKVAVLHSPGTDLWMLSVSGASEAEVTDRMQKLTDFIGQWGKAEYFKHGVGYYGGGTVILEHERTEGSFQKFNSQYLSPVPFFR